MTERNELLDWEGGGGQFDAPQPESPSSPAWMLSLADLVSLLLTFFVLLFALTGVRIDKWEKVVDALSSQIKPPLVVSEPVPTALQNIARVQTKQAIGLKYLSRLFDTIIADTPELKGVQTNLFEDRLVLSFPSEGLFVGDSLVVSAAAKRLLSSIGGVLNGLSNEIGVAGHTSPLPEGGEAFKSNWEFSMARAGAVANILREVGVSKPFRVYGMAYARFNDLPDISQEERLMLSRRVDIVILPSWRRGL